mgnify:FL=1
MVQLDIVITSKENEDKSREITIKFTGDAVLFHPGELSRIQDRIDTIKSHYELSWIAGLPEYKL